jgi:flagellar biosynthesis GTPase FlhF
MQILRFEGNDVQEAMKRAQIALGPDALILKTNRLDVETIPGTMIRRRVEVLAVASQGDAVCVSKPAARLLGDFNTRTICLKPGFCTTIAVVGPTGSGKTGAIAKLASAALEAGSFSFALISTDHQRIGAIEQLLAYSKLLNCPHSVVRSTDEMNVAKSRYSKCDMLFVDTPGISPHETSRLTELNDLLRTANADEVHLCLPLTSGVKMLEAVNNAYRLLHPTQVLLTKIDEAAEPLLGIRAAIANEIPLSYVITGQQLSGDILPANRDVIERQVNEDRS